MGLGFADSIFLRGWDGISRLRNEPAVKCVILTYLISVLHCLKNAFFQLQILCVYLPSGGFAASPPTGVLFQTPLCPPYLQTVAALLTVVVAALHAVVVKLILIKVFITTVWVKLDIWQCVL